MLRMIVFSRHALITGLIALATAAGFIGVARELSDMYVRRQTHPYVFAGDIFAPIRDAAGNAWAIGYLTDRDIKSDAVSMRFTQAQFSLAPVVLDLNNPAHHYLILDFSTPQQAYAAAVQSKAKPLKISPQGIIFAERTDQ